MSTILLLLFKTPLRKLLIIGLDRAKRGRAPLVVKSVGATVFVIMMYNVYSVTEIQSRPVEAVVNPTDQIILAYHMLEASLMGFSRTREAQSLSEYRSPTSSRSKISQEGAGTYHETEYHPKPGKGPKPTIRGKEYNL
ncbi:B-cell receptor-associated protein 31-like protein [Tanacetum coccineum]|uniref:Endoplasmic reticulum transmembrane protein n=1 Tax=Tanacetum coccineum TaxID=301880 RepID=A0ABQ5D4N0_9ASTR